MKDYLKDLVEHTYDLGFIEIIKIVGTDKDTQIKGLPEDQSVVVEAEFKNPLPEFIGTFGMPNLAKLKTLLSLQEYGENAKISLTRRSTGEPDGIAFENAAGDFKNNYRFMSEGVVNEKVKYAKFRGVTWDVEFQPTNAAIQRLKWQMAANSEEPNFQARTENGDLKFFFGDHSTHAGNFVFHPGVSGEIKRAWSWPAKKFAAIMDLTGDKTVRISDGGATQITVDSGLAVYNYILPAQTK
jgi:hypothetical protein